MLSQIQKSQEKEKMRLFVVGYFGYHNIGDDAMYNGFISYIHEKYYGNVGKDYDLQIKVMKNGDSLKRCIKRLIWANKIVLCGGTHLRNWGKRWLLQSARIICLAIITRMLRKGFYMINVGIDGSCWEKIAYSIATAISSRDVDSFDSAVLIPFTPQKQERVIGVNLTPVNAIYYNNPIEDWVFLLELREALDYWLEDNPDWQVKFFSFNDNTKYSDEKICQTATSLVKNLLWYLISLIPD